MKSGRIILAVTCLFLSHKIGKATAASQKVLAFVHATVIDVTGAAALPNTTVVITGDRITAIGQSANELPPKDADIVDATGKFLIPGLWDMHVHWEDKDYLPLFIANGVTGIRIMWGMPMHHEWRKEIEKGSLIGPHMMIASAIVDGPDPVWPGSVLASNEAEGRLAVKMAKQEGADFVKVYDRLPRDAYFAIADEAKKENIPFEGHVPMLITAEEASAAGQKTIEHLTRLLSACSSHEAELLKSTKPGDSDAQRFQRSILAMDNYSPAKAAELFALFKRNHTWQCPTLTVLRTGTSLGDPSFTKDIRLKYMPPETRSEWNQANEDRSIHKFPAATTFLQRYFQKHMEIVGAMQQAGVDILAGTDTLNPFCFPGFSLHDELVLLVRAGLTPMQALQTATLNPARFMGRENELGTIAKGKLADLVILDANPLENIANTQKINAVVMSGRLFSRSSLDGMLADIESLEHFA
jgi:imidazolonepropionase-like amidohydrolase